MAATATAERASRGTAELAVPLSASRAVEVRAREDGSLEPVAVFHRWGTGCVSHPYGAACQRCEARRPR